MTHRENSRAFSRRYGRCFWKRAQQFSSADKPTPEGLASAGITNVGSAEGHIHEATIQADGGTSDQGTGPKLTAQRNVGLAGAPHAASRQREETAGAPSSAATDNGASAGSSPEQRGSHEVTSKPDQQRPTPLSDHSAGGGVCCAMLAAQVHADRWATLAVIAVFICAFAVAAIRANRPQRPQSPPRRQSSARPRLSGDE